MASKMRRCERCGKRLREHHLTVDCEWNMVVEAGIITAVICPGCQTPMDHMEAEINHATLDYGMHDGRLVARPKGGWSS